jgi:tetraacyldisaccharide 4'-kinase
MLSDDLRLFGQRLIESNPWYLAPLSWIYAALCFFRNALYDLKILPSKKVNCTVVSVGNIAAGGTGKTPFVHLLASKFPHRRVAILSQGYGAFADEPALLAHRLPQVKIFVGKNRAKLAHQIASNFDLLILDDGFQHRKLYRDVDIVLTNNEKRYLPWGFLRDSPRRIRCADAIFDQSELELKIHRILDLSGNVISSISGKKVALFCGIAKPLRFRKTVEALGAIITAEKVFADHGRIDLSLLPKADLYVCTEKDRVKLPQTKLPIIYLEMQLSVNKSLNKIEKLVEKIDQKIDNKSQL